MLLDRFDGVLDEKTARFYLAEIALALHDLHNMGYVHRSGLYTVWDKSTGQLLTCEIIGAQHGLCSQARAGRHVNGRQNCAEKQIGSQSRSKV